MELPGELGSVNYSFASVAELTTRAWPWLLRFGLLAISLLAASIVKKRGKTPWSPLNDSLFSFQCLDREGDAQPPKSPRFRPCATLFTPLSARYLLEDEDVGC